MALINNIVAYWPLNEESGTREDSVGSNDLTDNNTVLYGTGKIGNTANFEEDTEESLSIADNADMSVGDIDFSFSCWILLETDDARKVFFGKVDSDGVNTSVEYYAEYYQPDDRFRFVVGDGSDVGIVKADNLGAPDTGKWYHIVCWHDATANTINIVVDDGTADSTAWTTGSQDTGNGFAIGRLGDYDDALHMDGYIDEFGFWKKVLSAADITRLYNSGDGLTYPFYHTSSLAGEFVSTGTIAKKTKKALAGPITFTGTITRKIIESIWRFKARFRDYFLTAPQKFTISSNKVQMTARYRDYYFTAPEREKHG